jgi:hypothetical protein
MIWTVILSLLRQAHDAPLMVVTFTWRGRKVTAVRLHRPPGVTSTPEGVRARLLAGVAAASADEECAVQVR